MATYYSNVYQSSAQRAERADGDGGFVQIAGRIEIPVGTAPATGDILKFFILPANAYLFRIAFANNDWGTTVPLDTLGNVTDDNGIVDTDIALGTARGYGTAAPLIYVNDSFTADTAWTASASIQSFAAATFPPSASNEAITGVIGSVTAGATTGCWLYFAAEIFVPNIASVVSTTGNYAYTWGGLSAGLGTATS